MSSQQNNPNPSNAPAQPAPSQDQEMRDTPEEISHRQYQIAIAQMRRLEQELEEKYGYPAQPIGKTTPPSVEQKKQESKALEDHNRRQAILRRSQQQQETKDRAIRTCEESTSGAVAQAAKTVYEDQPTCSPSKVFAQPAAPADLLRQRGAREFVHSNRIRKASRRPVALPHKSKRRIEEEALEKEISEMKL